jgi:hypothetical protein
VLLTSVEEAGESVPNDVWRSRKLVPFAVEARYLSVSKEVTEAQYREAAEIAEAVVRWAEGILSVPGP